jgi:hypothetical protein
MSRKKVKKKLMKRIRIWIGEVDWQTVLDNWLVATKAMGAKDCAVSGALFSYII